MKKILVLYDILHNGKTGKFYNNIDCILKQNDRVSLLKLKIINNNIIFNNQILNINNYDIVIFNYNEDKFFLNDTNPKFFKFKIIFFKIFKSWNNYIQYLQFIKQIINKKKPNMIIYNNPDNHNIIVDTFQNYKFVLDNNIPINVPDIKILDKKDIETIEKYPNIISIKEQTGGNSKYLCKNKIELLENYLELEKTKKEIIICPFLDTYNKDLECFLSIRIFCINDILIDFISRPSKNWNVHNSNIIFDQKILKNADLFFEKWLKENKEQFNNFLVKLYNILGPGLFCHDLIIHKNQLYLTELGYKSYEAHFHKLLDQNKIKMGKKFEKIKEYIKFYNDTISNYKY